MKYEALATDYDGTIAAEGRVDEPTVAALRRVREAGRRLLMVTGRELTDLSNTFDHLDLFDLVVVENGAVIHDPGAEQLEVLAPAPPRPFIDRLQAQQIPLSVGHCIVATVVPHDQALTEAIRELGLDWHVILNKDNVMALPMGVTKATGLQAALRTLGIAPEHTIGLGDAENDYALLDICGLAVAVDNALDSVKEMADVATTGARGAGAIELIDRWLDGDLEELEPRARAS